MQSVRRCKKCGEEKPLHEFPKHDAGFRHECYACYRFRYRKWSAKRRDIINARHRKEYKKLKRNPEWFEKRRINRRASHERNAGKLKDEVFLAYGGFKCACCGESEKLFLTIDHINNDGATLREQQGLGSSFYKWLKKHRFPPDYQVLCRNCNWGKHVNGGTCPHKLRRFNDHSERK